MTFELLIADTIEDRIVTFTDDIAEWNYGDYEGLKSNETRKLRKDRGLDTEREWSIWADGCEGGEYATFFFYTWLLLILSGKDLCIKSHNASTGLSRGLEIYKSRQ